MELKIIEWSSSRPSAGLSKSISASEEGTTTHRRPRQDTSDPGGNCVLAVVIRVQ